MENHTFEKINNFVSPDEWMRLVRLCTRITGNSDVAEDLAQETLVEAWQHQSTLRDAERWTQWLSGIARNVCLRWMRKRGRDSAHLLNLYQGSQNVYPDDLENVLVDDCDIEIELERKELLELLDRAMAILPTETQAVLIKRYVEESPLSEVAAQLGTNTSAIAMRLQRGKIALRRVLTTQMRDEFSSYVMDANTTDEWEETPLWCYICGQRRLQGKRNQIEGKLLLKCHDCGLLSENHLPTLKGVIGFKPLYSRLVH